MRGPRLLRQSPSHPSAAAQVDGCAAFTLDVVAEVMKNITAAGNDALLNPHFRSQKTGGCFGGQGNAPQAWSRVIEISNATAISELAQHLGTTLAFPHAHESFSHEIEVSDQARQDLEAATAEEAAFLALARRPRRPTGGPRRDPSGACTSAPPGA